MKLRWLLCPFALCCALAGCAHEPAAPPEDIRAVYFAPDSGGALSAEDLAGHPEVTVVYSLDDLKRAASGGAAVWVDRETAEAANSAWLRTLECPVVVAGCGDGLYAFAALLDFPIEVPEGAAMDEDAQGFCVWVTVTEQSGFVSQRMKGFKDVPVTVEAIFSAIDEVMGG